MYNFFRFFKLYIYTHTNKPYTQISYLSLIIAVHEIRRPFALATASAWLRSNLPFLSLLSSCAAVASPSTNTPPPLSPHRRRHSRCSVARRATSSPRARADRAAARRPAIGRWPRGGDRPSAPPPAEPRLLPSDRSAPGVQPSRRGRAARSPADETWCVPA
jgi:hypothetical protein